MLSKGEKEKKGFVKRLIEITGSVAVVPRVVESNLTPVLQTSITAECL